MRGRLRVAEHDVVEPDRAALRRADGLGGADAERRADGGAERGESPFVFLTPVCMYGSAECGKRLLVSCFSRPSRVFGVPRAVKLESVVCWQSAAPSAQPTAADERVLPPAPTTPVFLFDGASRAAFFVPAQWAAVFIYTQWAAADFKTCDVAADTDDKLDIARPWATLFLYDACVVSASLFDLLLPIPNPHAFDAHSRAPRRAKTTTLDRLCDCRGHLCDCRESARATRGGWGS